MFLRTPQAVFVKGHVFLICPSISLWMNNNFKKSAIGINQSINHYQSIKIHLAWMPFECQDLQTCGPQIPDRIGILIFKEMLVFEEEAKTGPKIPSEQGQESTTNLIEPGPATWVGIKHSNRFCRYNYNQYCNIHCLERSYKQCPRKFNTSDTF